MTAMVFAILAAGAGSAVGWWFGYGQGFKRAILGSELVPVDEQARTAPWGAMSIKDDEEGVA